jgi:alcohol dehydrogenase (cytochrome c)
VTGSYDVASHRSIWGVGNPVPMFDPSYRPGDNLYTNSVIVFDPDDGKFFWHHQYTPGDMWDYDEIGSHILIDAEVGGVKRSIVTHAARNGFLYAFDRGNGQTLHAIQYIPNVNWTKGIDQKTGKPVDYDPAKDIQTYSGLSSQDRAQPTKQMCPSPSGGNNFWPVSYSDRTKNLYIPALTVCVDVTWRPDMSNKGGGWRGGTFTRGELPYSTQLSIADPLTGETKKKVTLPYADYSGALTTAGGLVFTAINDGSFMAFDDETLEQLWRINLGTGFTAPPMSFEVGGKQYVAILSGGSSTAINKNVTSPELKDMRNQTLLWVFGL